MASVCAGLGLEYDAFLLERDLAADNLFPQGSPKTGQLQALAKTIRFTLAADRSASIFE